jgi:2-phospho-L-lactate guanylyltransferase
MPAATISRIVSRPALAGPSVAMILVFRLTPQHLSSAAATVPPTYPRLAVPTVLCALPLKPFDRGKERLAGAVSGLQRNRLSRAVAAAVLDACRDAGAAVAVVTSDDEVRRWALERGAATIREPDGGGLDGAAAAAAAAAAARRMGFAIVHADLPLLQPDDIEVVIDALRPGGAVLAPSRDGGTNVLAATDSLPFHYGPGSFRRHLAAVAGRRPAVVVRPGLCVDIDSPGDVAGVVALRAGAWIGGFVEEETSPPL